MNGILDATARAADTGRAIRGDGCVGEVGWLDWLARLRPASVALDDLLRSAQRLVVVSPHPDDEVLACGGLLALHAQRGGRTAVIAVTDGEASHRGDPAWSAARLAPARRAESERGLAHLGLPAQAVTRLSLPDGGVAAQRGDLAQQLRRQLQPGDCVLSTWRLDGHPDHEATACEAAEACGDTGCRLVEAPVWMWHWSHPADPRVPWHRLRALPLSGATMARKAAALAEHATQLADRGDRAPVLGPAILARAAWGSEYFFV